MVDEPAGSRRRPPAAPLAMVFFAESYADQSERDYQALVDGRVKAETSL
jgi:hypothetical protein